MTKFVSSLAALALFGSFAATSGAFASTQDEALYAQASDAQTIPFESLGISAEERERRVQVCERAWEACLDWCKRTKQSGVCREKCTRDLSDCMKEIPYEGE